jgi:hypothetical protein
MTPPPPAHSLDASATIPTHEPEVVCVSLGSVLPLLLEAAQNDYAWVNDFADDQIAMSRDLFDLLRFYAHGRRRAG